MVGEMRVRKRKRTFTGPRKPPSPYRGVGMEPLGDVLHATYEQLSKQVGHYRRKNDGNHDPLDKALKQHPAGREVLAQMFHDPEFRAYATDVFQKELDRSRQEWQKFPSGCSLLTEHPGQKYSGLEHLAAAVNHMHLVKRRVNDYERRKR